MKLLLTVSVLLCVFVVMVSSAAISTETNKDINTAIDKMDGKALSRAALVAEPVELVAPFDIVRHCTVQGQHCSSSHPRCCSGLSCISHRCAPTCTAQGQHCSSSHPRCCSGLSCISHRCAPPCTAQGQHCSSSHPRCCSGLSCISHKCMRETCVSHHSTCGRGKKCCGSRQCVHGRCEFALIANPHRATLAFRQVNEKQQSSKIKS